MFWLSTRHVSSIVLHTGNPKMTVAGYAWPQGAWSNRKVHLNCVDGLQSILHLLPLPTRMWAFQPRSSGQWADSHLFCTHDWFRDGCQSFHWLNQWNLRAFISCWAEKKFFSSGYQWENLIITLIPWGTNLQVDPGRQGQKKCIKMKPNDSLNLWIKLYLKPDSSFHLCEPIYFSLGFLYQAAKMPSFKEI